MTIQRVYPVPGKPEETQRKIAEAVNAIAGRLQPFGARLIDSSDDMTVDALIYDCDATAGGIVMTAGPAAGYAGMTFVVVKADATANTVIANAGTVSHTLTVQNQTVTIASTGSRWVIL